MPPNPETPQPPPPTEQNNRQTQPPEGRDNRQPVTPQQRTGQTMDRMITGMDQVMLAMRDLNVRANTPGTPESQIRGMFQRFMGRLTAGSQPDAATETERGHLALSASDWLRTANMTMDDVRQAIRTADATSNLEAGFVEAEAVGGQLQVRSFSPNGDAKEYLVAANRTVTVGRGFRVERLSQLIGQNGVQARDEFRIDQSNTQLIQMVRDAQARGLQLTMNPTQGIRVVFNGQVVAECLTRNGTGAAENLRSALQRGLERANAAPTTPPTTPTPPPTAAPTGQ